MEDKQEEIVRLLAIQVRRGSGSQSEAIVEMSKAGFGPSRIAQLLGTTANTVNVALNNAKKPKSKPAKGTAKRR
jgi:DNA-binding CsgD family transcriptional regulator